MKTLTILVPVLNEEENLPVLRSRLEPVLKVLEPRIRAEIIILDNCSQDGTRAISHAICESDPRWKYVRYSRNFGYHNSLAAGYDLASGDALIVLAGDLQEPPELIPRMVGLWEEGYDVAYGVLEERNDSNLVKTFGAKVFYELIYKVSETPLPKSATDFRIISRRVIDVVRSMREPDRYLRGMVHWTGFKQAHFQYDREKRVRGKSTAGILYSANWAINAIICFSAAPLRLAAYVGLMTMLLTGVASVYFVWARVFPPEWMPIPPTGTTFLILLLLLAIGLNAFFLGIIGEYVGRIYSQGKFRPLYVIEESINLKISSSIGSAIPGGVRHFEN